MKVSDMEPPLLHAIEAVIPRLLKEQMKPGSGISKNDFEQIFFRLLMTTNAQKASQYIKQFNQFLVFAGAVQVDENSGVSVTRIKRPTARITIDFKNQFQLLGQMEKVFMLSLEELPVDTRIRVGQILFSAIRHGGLLRKELLKAFIKALSEPPFILESHIWYELKENEAQIGQIWNPDPLTLTLLYNWYNEGAHKKWETIIKSNSVQLMKLIENFFSYYHLNCKKMNQKRLLETVNAQLSLEIPPVLVDCASGLHDSRSLHPDVYLRLISAKAPNLNKIGLLTRPQVMLDRTTIKPVDTSYRVGTRDKKLLLLTGQLLRSSNERRIIADEIEKNIIKESPKCTPITIYLCRWIGTRLTQSNRWGNRYAAKSAYTRLHSIARRLMGWLGAEDPINIGTQKLIEIYEEIIDSVDRQSLRISIAKNLREFQEYLEDELGVGSIDSDAPWLGMDKQDGAVDAKIILPEEYKVASDYYLEQASKAQNPNEKKLSQARFLVLALGYRAGMRRKEVIGLQIKDITTYGKQEVLVRPHDERKIKSLSGNRRVPLTVFFNEIELKTLNLWLSDRKKDTASLDDYLFKIPKLNTPFINESLIFDHIQWLLQILTGDPKARFHHLRHSFGTWRFWKWMLPRYYEYQECYKSMECFDSEQLKDERRKILGVSEGNEESQKIAYAIAMVIGHSGPSMTLNYYIHSDHWMREIELRRMTPAVSSKLLANLTNVSVRQIQKLAKDGKYTANLVLPRLIKRLKRIAIKPNVKGWKKISEKKIPGYKRETGYERQHGIDIWEAIQRYSYQKATVQELEKRYCIASSILEAAISRAKLISEMSHSSPSYQTYRHRIPKQKGLDKPPIVFRYPHAKRHLEQVESALKRYDILSESKKLIVQWSIGYFLSNSSFKRPEVEFRNKKELRRFLRMISALEFFDKEKNLPRYRLTHYSSEDLFSEQRNKQWNFWERGLNLKKYQKKLKFKKSASQKNGYVGLNLLSFGPKNKKQKENPGEMQSDWGFRLSLYVLAIIYGWSTP